MFWWEKNIQVNKKYELEDKKKYDFLEDHLRNLDYSNAWEKEFENMLVEIEKIWYDIKKAAAIVFKIVQEKELKIIELEEENKRLREKDIQAQKLIPILLQKAKELDIKNDEVLKLESSEESIKDPWILSKTVGLLQDKVEKKWISKRILNHVKKNPLDEIYAESELDIIDKKLWNQTVLLRKLFDELIKRKKERDQKNEDKKLWWFKSSFWRKK